MSLQFKNIFNFILLLLPLVFYGQIFKASEGDLNTINGINRYEIVFEYADNIVNSKYGSEKLFLENYSKNKDKKSVGSGEAFKLLWYTNRKQRYEPKLIQEFNYFNLKDKQVTVAKSITDSKYIMVVRTNLIEVGNSNFFFKKDARLEVVIRIYKTSDPDTILYKTTTINVHSKGANSGDYKRIISAYAQLGRAMSKHFSRKT